MRVLCMGKPFFCDASPIPLYRGPHEIRFLGIEPACDFHFDPARDTAAETLKRIARTWAPDLFLCWMPEAYSPPVGIEHAPVKTVAFVSDWNVYHPILACNLARFDVVACDRRGAEALRTGLVSPRFAMPLYSAVTQVHRRLGLEKDIDVLFVGNLSAAAHPVRARLLERLARLSDQYRVVITGGVFGLDYARLINRARLVFNYSIRGELNLRVFETLACGSAAMLESDNHEVRDYLKPDAEIAIYDPDSLEERVESLLAHPQEVRALADAGHARACEFAGENRLNALIEWAASQPESGRLFLTLPEGEQRYQDVVFYSQSRFSGHGETVRKPLRQLVETHRDDPRVWTAVAQCASLGLDPVSPQDPLAALARAHTCDPGSAVYAFNAGSGCLACGDTERALGYFVCSANCSGASGETSLFGAASDPFVIRWRRAVAEREAWAGMVRAEAHIRAARILAARDALTEAENHLQVVEHLDPASTSGIVDHVELLWETGRRVQAVDLMQRRLPELPLNLEARQRLCDMLAALGMRAEALALARESLRISRAFVDDPASL